MKAPLCPAWAQLEVLGTAHAAAPKQVVEGPLAAGMSPRGTSNNLLLYSCYQLVMPADWVPIISREGGERSCCLDTNPARFRFFLGLYPGNGIMAGRGLAFPRPCESGGPTPPPPLGNLQGPAVGCGQGRLRGEGQLPSGWPPRDSGAESSRGAPGALD